MSIEEIPPSPTVEGAEDNVSSTEISVPDAPKLCGVCNEKVPKYKCTRCQLPYCSVACSTQHKATHPAIDTTSVATPDSIAKSNADVDQPKARAGTVGFRDPFAALEDSDKLRELFKQYPRLPTQLEEIHTATLQPLDEMDGQAQFKSRGGGRGGKQRWNRDKGIQNGLAALSVARSTHGKDGEAVREFCKLVLQILSGEQEVAVELMEKERTEEDRKIIQELLSRELR